MRGIEQRGTARLLRGFTLIELMIVVAILGVLAAIAIPSFSKSVRRARTSEALVGLRKLYDGAVVYYDRDHTNAVGDALARQFPAPEGPTPINPPAGRKLDPDPALWTAPTWQALDFAISDPHYYAYQFASGGTGVTAEFGAIAQGDLDGDGLESWFSRGGHATPSGDVEGFAGVVRINPLE